VKLIESFMEQKLITFRNGDDIIIISVLDFVDFSNFAVKEIILINFFFSNRLELFH
jgi:hypothetical protein